MTAQEAALIEVAHALAESRVDYMVIGGMANIVWGEPRATLDVDITVWVEEPQLAGVIGALVSRFRALAADPVAFVRECRVLPLESGQEVRIDVVFGLLPFERDAIARAVLVEIAGATVRVCTPEDLIVMKIISERERDLADAEGVTLRRFEELDLAYLDPRIRELADVLGRPEIAELWEAWKSRAIGR